MAMARSIEQLIEYCALNGIGGPISCEGCSDAEIELLEQQRAVAIPNSYSSFLSHMGHSACYLFAHDHTTVNYTEAMTLHDELPARFDEEDVEFTIDIPDDGVLIGSRLGDWHWFIRCNEPDDSPVWSFGITGQHAIEKQNDSFVEWLFGWATEAELVLKQRNA